MLEENQLLAVLELWVMKLFREVFKLLRMQSFFHFFIGDDECLYYTRKRKQRLLTITYSRTVTKSTSVENRLRNTYNGLKERDLIPKGINCLNHSQMTVQQ